MKKILLCVLFALCLPAHAVDFYWLLDQNGTQHSNPTSACQSAPWASWFGPTYQYKTIVLTQTDGNGPSAYRCIGENTANGGESNPGWNAIRLGDGCTAPKVYDAATGICAAPSCPGVSTSINLAWPVGYVGADGRPIGALNIPAMGTAVAHNGCAYSIGNAVANSCTSNPAATPPRLVSCSYQANGLGRDATGADALPTAPPAPSTTPDDGKCPSGTVSGGVDSAGIPICVGGKTGAHPDAGKETTSKPPAVTNPDGSTTETEIKERVNADGSKTTTTTTTNTGTDGSKSITVSQVTSGKPTGEPGKDDENSDFCEKNPQLTICKNSTVSGSCENTACEGDAIQCEILRVARKRQCSEETETAQSQLGQQLLDGNDPLGGSLPKASNALEVNIGTSLDQSGFLGAGGTCLNDKTFSAGGMSFTLPFSSVCPYLLPFRYMMMIIAALLSLRLVGKSIFA